MINPDDLKREALEIEKELEIDTKKIRKLLFFKVVMALVLILLMVVLVIPRYSIRVDPIAEPVARIDFNFSLGERLDDFSEVRDREVSEEVRYAASRIATESCEGYSNICYAKAVYNYVRDYTQYVSDPEYEYIQSAEETLLSGAGDCDDHAVLVDSLMNAIGINSRIVIVPGHAYNEIYIKDAPKKYVRSNGWIPLDAACKSCEFGELSKEYDAKSYV